MDLRLLRSRRSPKRSGPAASVGTRRATALPFRMSRGPSSRSHPRRASALPGRRRGSVRMPQGAHTPIRLASGCAAGSASARIFSTILRSSPSSPWASVSPASTPRAATCLHGANAPNCGASQCLRLFPIWSSFCSLGNTRRSGILAQNHRQEPQRNGRPVARHLSVNRSSASVAHAASLLAEQRLAQAQSLVRNGAVAGSAGGHCPDRRVDERVRVGDFEPRPRLT